MSVATKNFTAEEIVELATIFGLTVKEPDNILPVRDGVVHKDDMVWWRGDSVPQHVKAERDWDNIRNYPEAYSVAEPRVKVQYLD